MTMIRIQDNHITVTKDSNLMSAVLQFDNKGRDNISIRKDMAKIAKDIAEENKDRPKLAEYFLTKVRYCKEAIKEYEEIDKELKKRIIQRLKELTDFTLVCEDVKILKIDEEKREVVFEHDGKFVEQLD